MCVEGVCWVRVVGGDLHVSCQPNWFYQHMFGSGISNEHTAVGGWVLRCLIKWFCLVCWVCGWASGRAGWLLGGLAGCCYVPGGGWVDPFGPDRLHLENRFSNIGPDRLRLENRFSKPPISENQNACFVVFQFFFFQSGWGGAGSIWKIHFPT